MDQLERRKRAKALKDAKKFNEALPLFQELWEGNNQTDGWDGWGMAYCLQKLGRVGEALDICRVIYRLDNSQEIWNNLYAECIYKLEVDLEEVDDWGRFTKAAAGILDLTEQSSKYSPYTRTIFKVCAQLKARSKFEEVEQWLEHLDKSLLSIDPAKFTKNGRSQSGPSDLERYYTFLCKALFETGQYEACREFAAEGTIQLKRGRRNGDFWLRWHHANADAALGNNENAYKGVKDLAQIKEQWFFYEKLAMLAREMGDTDQAWQYMFKALSNGAPPVQRVNVFSLAANWLWEEGAQDKARQHMQIALKIRQENDWPIKGDLLDEAQVMAVETSNLPASRKLIKDLHGWWQKRLDECEPSKKGKVVNLISDGKAGFIETSDGENFFFQQRDVKGASLKVGESVTFKTKPGFDRKKNRPTVNATRIQRIP